MKSGNINTRNTEKNIIVDLNVHFFLTCFPDFDFLQLLPLEKIFFSRVGLVMFKCSNNMLSNVISNLYIKNNEIHSHFTRNSNLLRIPKGTPNFITISARVWNEIVTKIIMDQHVSISKFKTMLKSYLLVSSFTLTYTK